TSLVSGRLARNASGRLTMGVGLAVAALGVLTTEIKSLPAVLIGLVILCVGMFIAQSTAPAFVNSNARRAKGGAGAPYPNLSFPCASPRSALPRSPLPA